MQGSAADIIKIAMINIHSVVVGGSASGNSVGMQYSMLKDQCRILLQVNTPQYVITPEHKTWYIFYFYFSYKIYFFNHVIYIIRQISREM